MSYPLVRCLAVEGIPVRLTCGVLGHSTQAYYAWVAHPVSDRDLDGSPRPGTTPPWSPGTRCCRRTS
jgi:hypothetical protein